METGFVVWFGKRLDICGFLGFEGFKAFDFGAFCEGGFGSIMGEQSANWEFETLRGNRSRVSYIALPNASSVPANPTRRSVIKKKRTFRCVFTLVEHLAGGVPVMLPIEVDHSNQTRTPPFIREALRFAVCCNKIFRAIHY